MNLQTAAKASRPKNAPSDWIVVVPLILLSLVPMLGGIARLSDLASGAAVTPENARFHAMPLPVLVHIFSSVPFSIMGAFQFAPGLRRRRPDVHRNIGKVLMIAGFASAVSGLFMTVFYPITPNLQGPLLWLVRLLVGSAMAVSIALAWRTILERKVNQHRAWMMRAYALGQGAGTQALILLPITLLFGPVEWLPRDLWMSLAWLINIAIAEWFIRKIK